MNDILNIENVETKPKNNRLKIFIKRIARLGEEKNNIPVDFKEVYSEVKSSGYDPKIIRKVPLILKIDFDERLQQELLLGNYKNALGIF